MAQVRGVNSTVATGSKDGTDELSTMLSGGRGGGIVTSFLCCVFCTLPWECLGSFHCELGWLPALLILSLGGLVLRNLPP